MQQLNIISRAKAAWSASPLMQVLAGATVQVGRTLIYLLFTLPLVIWCRSVNELSRQCAEAGVSTLGGSRGSWPLLSYIKAMVAGWLFDALIFLSWPAGIVWSIVMACNATDEQLLWLSLINLWLSAFYAPVAVNIARDVLRLLWMPVSRFMGWLRKT